MNKFLGFIIALGGIGIMGGCFYAAYLTKSEGWGIGGFLAGMAVIGAGCNVMTR